MSLLEGRVDNESWRVAVPLHICRRYHDYVKSLTQPPEFPPDFYTELVPVNRPLNDDQQVDVAVGAHLAAGRRAEQDDLDGVGDLDNAPDDLLELFLLRVSARLIKRPRPSS